MSEWIAVVGIVGVALGGVLLVRRSEKRQVEKFLADREPQPRDVFVETHFGVDEQRVAATLLGLLARHLPIDLNRIRPDDRLVDDLRMDALDSMSTVEFVMDIEKAFSIEIADEEAARLVTFREIVSCVAQQLARRNSRRPDASLEGSGDKGCLR